MNKVAEQITPDNSTTGAPDTSGMSLSVVIPAYNEENAVRHTVEDVRTHLEPLNIPYEIIVVDDASQDNTRAEAEASGATVTFNDVNSGYGASLKRGVRMAQYEYVAILDADSTYPARYLPGMLAMCRDQDMVVGDRGAAMKNVPLLRRPAKKFLFAFASFLAERKINDLNSGLRVFRKSELIPFLPLLPQNFSFTTTITLCMTSNGKRMIYTPIEYGKRVGKSKIRPIDFSELHHPDPAHQHALQSAAGVHPSGSGVFHFGHGEVHYRHVLLEPQRNSGVLVPGSDHDLVAGADRRHDLAAAPQTVT